MAEGVPSLPALPSLWALHRRRSGAFRLPGAQHASRPRAEPGSRFDGQSTAKLTRGPAALHVRRKQFAHGAFEFKTIFTLAESRAHNWVPRQSTRDALCAGTLSFSLGRSSAARLEYRLSVPAPEVAPSDRGRSLVMSKIAHLVETHNLAYNEAPPTITGEALRAPAQLWLHFCLSMRDLQDLSRSQN
ncbi:hypothetical protein M885DRAFT_12725 [Pelagophyceae sp. CCMP2097]|nr:hypothetical protein M885DRAFT_12725 [Pelagophyceae sp. CCMP2097]